MVGATTATTERLLTRVQAAAFCQVHPTTITRWVRRGLVKPVLLPGGSRRYRESDLTRAQADDGGGGA